MSSALLAAQKSASREPAVQVIVRNTVGAVRRNDFAVLDTTSHPLAKHDAAVAADGSVTRVRIESGAVKQQRVADPASGPWSSWNDLATAMGTAVACAAKGARVAVVYIDAAGTGIKLRESTDNGVSYGSEQAVTTSPASVVDLAVAYKNSSGDLAIAWASAANARIIKRTSGAFGSVSTMPGTVSSFNGIAMTYGFDWDILLAGVEATSLRPTLWTAIHGDGNDEAAGVWGASIYPQQQAEADASITFQAPSIMYTDTYRITFVEVDAFAGGATRTYRSHLHPSLGFGAAAGPFSICTPAPVDYGGAQGLALAHDTSWVYEAAPDRVQRASDATVTLDVSAAVLAVELEESTESVRGHVDLDNSGGAFTGPPSPLAVGNLVSIGWGYRTSSGPAYSFAADTWIAAYEHRRAGGVSTLRLHLEGGWEALRRNRQRAQIVHTADPYRTVLLRIFSRAGLVLTVSGASSRSLNVLPRFTVHPQTSAFEAAQRALAFLADRIAMRSVASAVLREPLPSDTTDYTFGTDHPLRAARLRAEPPPVSEALAFGDGAFGESIDYAAAALGLGSSAQLRDLASDTNAEAAATAAAHLRQRALDADAGEIVVPPNVGQEIFDVVELSDPLIAASPVRRRVAALRWRYDAPRAIYEQMLRLGPL
ncbi:MAG: hypothetical protein WEC75_03100 [Dehalococcoidia bacterium]